jgi:hypothetical protein
VEDPLSFLQAMKAIRKIVIFKRKVSSPSAGGGPINEHDRQFLRRLEEFIIISLNIDS